MNGKRVSGKSDLATRHDDDDDDDTYIHNAEEMKNFEFLKHEKKCYISITALLVFVNDTLRQDF